MNFAYSSFSPTTPDRQFADERSPHQELDRAFLSVLSKTMETRQDETELEMISHWNWHISNLNCARRPAANGEPTESCVYRMMASTQVWFDAFVNIMLRPSRFMPWISFALIIILIIVISLTCTASTTSTFWQPHHNFLALQSSENLSCRFREECINLFQLAGKCRQNEIGPRRICIRALARRRFAAFENWNICSLYCERVSARSFNRH